MSIAITFELVSIILLTNATASGQRVHRSSPNISTITFLSGTELTVLIVVIDIVSLAVFWSGLPFIFDVHVFNV